MQGMIGSLYIFIAAILWAFDGVLRRGLYVLPPLTIVFIEHVVGTILLLPILLGSVKRLRQMSVSDWGTAAWVSLFSSVLGTLWFTTALFKANFIPFSVVFLLQKLQPIFVFMTAVIFLRERITLKRLFWSGIALVAAYFVTFPMGNVNFETGAGTIAAAGYALAAAFAWGTSTVFSRKLLLKLPPLAVSSLRFVLATLFAGVLLLLNPAQQAVQTITSTQLFIFVAIALSTGMVALVIYYKGLAKTPATVATIVELAFPLTAVFIDAVLYKVVLHPTQYVAAAFLVLSGIMVSQKEKSSSTKLPLSFVSTIIQGKGRGKFLGYPTINMKIPSSFAVQDGIYAAKVNIDGKSYSGALHFGPIPTFQEKKKSLEVFILNTFTFPQKKLLRSKIEITLVAYLREIKKFSAPYLLIDQITKDVKEVKSILRK